ncbi:MAG: hypothetical protein PHF60_03730 [Candidatus ainarchaeum sp.]|nr:hypothetical protein [Candidatus ainarchaeum sp.]
MIVKAEMLEEYRQELAQAAKGINEKDLEWMRNRFISETPGLSMARDASERESLILLGLARLAKAIRKAKPKDLRAFVDIELRRRGYRNDIGLVENQVFRMKTPDTELLQKLENRLNEIEKRIAKEDPNYSEEIRGKLTLARRWLKNKKTGKEVEFK